MRFAAVLVLFLVLLASITLQEETKQEEAEDGVQETTAASLTVVGEEVGARAEAGAGVNVEAEGEKVAEAAEVTERGLAMPPQSEKLLETAASASLAAARAARYGATGDGAGVEEVAAVETGAAEAVEVGASQSSVSAAETARRLHALRKRRRQRHHNALHRKRNHLLLEKVSVDQGHRRLPRHVSSTHSAGPKGAAAGAASARAGTSRSAAPIKEEASSFEGLHGRRIGTPTATDFDEQDSTHEVAPRMLEAELPPGLGRRMCDRGGGAKARGRSAELSESPRTATLWSLAGEGGASYEGLYGRQPFSHSHPGRLFVGAAEYAAKGREPGVSVHRHVGGRSDGSGASGVSGSAVSGSGGNGGSSACGGSGDGGGGGDSDGKGCGGSVGGVAGDPKERHPKEAVLTPGFWDDVLHELDFLYGPSSQKDREQHKFSAGIHNPYSKENLGFANNQPWYLPRYYKQGEHHTTTDNWNWQNHDEELWYSQ